MITFQQQETTEIKNRIRVAWATFYNYKQELTSKSYLLRHRLRIFSPSGHPNDELRLGNMDPHKRTRQNDPIDTAQSSENETDDGQLKHSFTHACKARPLTDVG